MGDKAIKTLQKNLRKVRNEDYSVSVNKPVRDMDIIEKYHIRPYWARKDREYTRKTGIRVVYRLKGAVEPYEIHPLPRISAMGRLTKFLEKKRGGI